MTKWVIRPRIPTYDVVVKNGHLVIPYTGVVKADVGIKSGKVAAISAEIGSTEGEDVVDASGFHVFPGAVDSHFHIGIYRPFSEDAESESRAAAVGGVTTILSYFRTGHHYLDKTGPYREIFPEVLELSRGHFYTDYGYHVAVMTAAQLPEVAPLVEEAGVGSFKFYMFYKALTLTADSTKGKEYTMAENYDLGHLYGLMERVAAVSHKHRAKGRIALSLHCENPELIRIFIDRVKAEGLQGLEAYSKSRPPLTERLSVAEAAILADATSCPVNLLHLSSREAVWAGVEARRNYPHLDIKLEVTLHHLCLSWEELSGQSGKVNPPIRTREDTEFLWQAVMSGEVDTVVSDHACCFEEQKQGDLWSALPGFGGSTLLYPVLLSNGYRKREIPLTRIAELASANPARHFGLYPLKGTIAVGSDADLVVVDLARTQKVTAEALQSAQDFTPFEGIELSGWPVETLLRGTRVLSAGSIVAKPGVGRFIKRPVGLHVPSV